jgi:type I restriction enzyme S subunit
MHGRIVEAVTWQINTAMNELTMTETKSLPPSWTVQPLGSVAKVGNGSTPKRDNDSYWTGGSIPWLNSAKIHDRFITTPDQFVTEIAVEECHLPRVRPDSLLIAITGQGKTLGNSALVRFETCINQHLAYADFTSDEVIPEFVLWFMQTQYERLRSVSKAGGSTKGALTCGYLRGYPIPIPPVSEQRKIDTVLGFVHRAMTQQYRLIKLITELKKTLLHQLFTRGINGEPCTQTEVGPVPQSWKVTKLGDIATLRSGGTPARDKPEYWDGGHIPWVKTGEIDYRIIRVTEESITKEGLANSAARIFPEGTLLIAMYGQGVTRGRVGLLGIDAATNQACAAIMPHDERRVSTRYIYHYLEYHYEKLRQMGHGANQRNLNAALIKEFCLSFPKLDEQMRIVEALGAVDTKLVLHQSKHGALAALFRTLLHELMTAQLRTNDIDLSGLGAIKE